MKNKAIFSLLIAGWFFLLATAQVALKMEDSTTKNVATLMKSTDPGAERFKSVGKLIAATHCTATLIAGDAPPSNDSPAMIITAGHCINTEMSTNQVINNQQASKEWKFIPNYFIDTYERSQPVAINRILYATMKNIDIAILELNTTYGRLARIGLKPLMLSRHFEADNQAIELVHIPVVDIEDNKQYLRHSSCHVHGQTPMLVESNHPWVWATAFPVDCAGVTGGTSGSPVVEKDSSKIIGILNTTTTPGLTGCGIGRPCELHNSQLSLKEGASYFMPVAQIAQAITHNGKLDLSTFEKNSTDILRRNGSWVTKSHYNGRQTTWNISVDEKVSSLRYKTGPANETVCADIQGYGRPVASATQPLDRLVVPSREGVYLLCVIHQQGNGQWIPSSYAARTLHLIDDSPPTLMPETQVEEYNDFWTVSPVPVPWALGEPWVKYGPLSSTNCGDKSGYHYYLMPVRLPKSHSPWRFCTYGKDQAGNAGPAKQKDFGISQMNVKESRI